MIKKRSKRSNKYSILKTTWKHLSLQEVADFAVNNLKLTELKDEQLSQAVINEAEQAHIRFVPTVILGKEIFDESISIKE